jgi:hypothetical protein
MYVLEQGMEPEGPLGFTATGKGNLTDGRRSPGMPTHKAAHPAGKGNNTGTLVQNTEIPLPFPVA